MQVPETFLGLTGTGWTAVGSMAGSLSILALVIYNFFYMKITTDEFKLQLQGVKLQLSSVLFSGCPVLTLRKDKKG